MAASFVYTVCKFCHASLLFQVKENTNKPAAFAKANRTETAQLLLERLVWVGVPTRPPIRARHHKYFQLVCGWAVLSGGLLIRQEGDLAPFKPASPHCFLQVGINVILDINGQRVPARQP